MSQQDTKLLRVDRETHEATARVAARTQRTRQNVSGLAIAMLDQLTRDGGLALVRPEELYRELGVALHQVVSSLLDQRVRQVHASAARNFAPDDDALRGRLARELDAAMDRTADELAKDSASLELLIAGLVAEVAHDYTVINFSNVPLPQPLPAPASEPHSQPIEETQDA